MPAVHAIILAAGLGTRLRSVVDDRPKGLIEIGGVSLVGRSVSLLREAGVRRIIIVAGYMADAYLRFASGQPDIEIVTNEAFATTGSMASLAIGLDRCPAADVLVVESDIVYEARALDVALAAPDVTLVSGPTGAGDEVWVSAPGGRLLAMSKRPGELPSVAGEFVGITCLSPRAADAMREAYDRFVAREGHARMDYETGAMVAVAATLPIAVRVVPDLCWGEIDDEQQYTRVVTRVWPVVTGTRDRVQ